MGHGWEQLTAAELRRGWLRAIAGGLLAASATFFAAHAVWRPEVAGARVQAVIEYEPGAVASGKGALDLERVRQDLLQPEALETALEKSGAAADPANLAAWQQAISVHRGYATQGAAAERIVVELATHQEAQAVHVLQQLTQRYLRDKQHDTALVVHGSADLAAARAAAAAALDTEDAARRALDNLVKEHYENLRRAEKAPQVPVEGPVIAPQRTVRQENDAWRKLQDEVAEVVARRDKLLATLMPAHPKVQDVDGELEELQSRLARTPRYLESPDEEAGPTLATRPPAASEPLLAAARAMAGQQGKMRDVLKAYEEARARRFEAQAAVEVLERSTAEAPAQAPRYALVQSAQAIEHFTAVSPAVRYLALLALSVPVWLAVVLALRPRQKRRTLASAEDVTQLLRVPVVAQLHLGSAR